jgi:uncharacterized delta-60 repeat protein
MKLYHSLSTFTCANLRPAVAMLAATTATLAATFLPLPAQALPPQVEWIKQLGTSGYDDSYGVATDSNGNVYISGFTTGALAGTNKGSYDAWVAKYNSSGSLLWKQQLGSSDIDGSSSVATDSSGNVYISGATYGNLAGTNKGSYDAFVAKYNSGGKLLWKKQWGTSGYDESSSVATDSSGNVYISGRIEATLENFDVFVAKYNSSGSLLWEKQLGTSSDDNSWGVATDSNGNVYISGLTEGALAGTNKGEYDAWVAKYNSSGKLQWKQQLGTSEYDYSYGVATDSSGNVYISGSTNGALAGTNKGEYDAWVAKYNSSGKLQWKQQLGTSGGDESRGVATDSSGNVYISGLTEGALAGTNKGSYDAWVAKYNSSGKLQWKQQLGTSSYDSSSGVALDGNGNVYISGATQGDLAGTNKGPNDAWVAKYSQQSQPYQGSRKPPRQDR